MAKCTAVSDLSSTTSTICASSTSGAVKCWGSIQYLGIEVANPPGPGVYLGDEPEEMGVFLPEVNLGTNRTVKEFAKGSSLLHTCALLDNGDLKCWGGTLHGALGGKNGYVGRYPGEMGDALLPVDLGSNRTAVQASIGLHHACAVLDNGDVKCWGLADKGRLGVPDPQSIGEVPEEMGDNLLPVDLGTNRTALQVSCGKEHTCAILDNHDVKCWGFGFHGALGSGDTANIGESLSQMGDNLKPVDLGKNRSAIQIECARQHTCALLDNHQMKCWGDGLGGQIGVTRPNPYRLGDEEYEMGDNLTEVNLGKDTYVLQISAASFHTCALLSNNQVKCFGSGYYGQLGKEVEESLGRGEFDMGDNLTFIDVGSNRSVVAIKAGYFRTCAILDDGSVKCWGYNLHGELGYGDRKPRGGVPNTMGDHLPIVDLSFGIPAPTPAPSTSPTIAPTDAPSVSPSLLPTSSPVLAQTSFPSVAPTYFRENSEDPGMVVGVAVATCAVFAFVAIAVFGCKNTSSSDVSRVGDGRNGPQHEHVRYEGGHGNRVRAPQLALAVQKNEKNDFPVAKVVAPLI